MAITPKKTRSGKTLLALGLGYFIDQGEGDAMGVLSPVIQSAWGISFGMLGLMETLRALFQTISAPIWGFLADRFSRKKILLIGTGIWGVWTLVTGFAADFATLQVVRAISGLGLGCLMPATFSLLGDHFSQEKRGRALGVIGLVGLLGTVGGVIALGFLATPELWRWGFFGLGIASILSGLLIWLIVEEPPRGAAEPEISDLITHSNESRYSIRWQDMFATLRIPTIWAAILQGVSGSMPWVVMGIYFINWMVKELGYSNDISLSSSSTSAPLIFALVVIAAAFGNLLGGFIGDFAEARNPRYGRTIIGQFAVFAGIPMMYVLLSQGKQMPFWGVFTLAVATAIIISWPGRGAKEPMMAAVVMPELRSSAYAMVSMIEGGIASFASLIAGSLADQYGLTAAMLWTVPFPWVICGLGFTLFYFTYPRDARKVREALSIRRNELLAGATVPEEGSIISPKSPLQGGIIGPSDQS